MILKTLTRFALSRFEIAIFGLNLLLHLVFRSSCYSNSTINPCLPSAFDSFQYTEKAQAFLDQGFVIAFGDAYRMPGYSLIIAIFIFIFESNSNIMLRIFQSLLTASTSVIAYRIMLKFIKTDSKKIGARRISIFYTFLPSWYFSPLLLAESMTYFLACVLVLRIANICKSGTTKIRDLYSISIIITTLTYLKPNNILILIPVEVLFLLYSSKKIRTLCLITSMVFIGLLPWLVFVNKDDVKHPILTTTSGGNLLIGTGLFTKFDSSPLARSAEFFKVDQESNAADLIDLPPNLDVRVANEIRGKIAIEVWKKRPLRQLSYAITKIPIAYGIWANSTREIWLGIYSLVVWVTTVLMIIRNQNRKRAYVVFSLLLCLSFQAMIFQADRRFVFPFLLPFSILILAQFIDVNYFEKLRFPFLLRLGRIRAK